MLKSLHKKVSKIREKDRPEIGRWIIQTYQVSLKLFCFEDSLINLFILLILLNIYKVFDRIK